MKSHSNTLMRSVWVWRSSWFCNISLVFAQIYHNKYLRDQKFLNVQTPSPNVGVSEKSWSIKLPSSCHIYWQMLSRQIAADAQSFISTSLGFSTIFAIFTTNKNIDCELMNVKSAKLIQVNISVHINHVENKQRLCLWNRMIFEQIERDREVVGFMQYFPYGAVVRLKTASMHQTIWFHEIWNAFDISPASSSPLKITNLTTIISKFHIYVHSPARVGTDCQKAIRIPQIPHITRNHQRCSKISYPSTSSFTPGQTNIRVSLICRR